MRGKILIAALWLSACASTTSSLSPDQPGVDVARAALRGGSPQIALQILSGTLAKDPGNEAALVLQGDAFTILGQYDQAQASYSSALNRHPGSVGAETGLGRILLTHDPAGAEKMFLDVLTHDPRNTAALNDLGVARDLRGDHTGAQEAYRHALGIDPQLSAAQVNLALSMAMTGNATDAVRLLRPMAESPGASPKLRHDLAAALTMAGQRDEAAHILSADLSPEEVRQALDAYATARSGGTTALLATSPHGEATPIAMAPTPVSATAPPVATSAAGH
jgi:Flp pilus assembly protein TadD